METVWIMGVGRFGSIAVNRLSKQHSDWQFVLVDPVKENLLKAKGPNITIKQTDGIKFLNDHLNPGVKVSWIIPSLPVHLVWEWCRIKIGRNILIRTRFSSEIDLLLPNPIHGSNGDIYVSYADFICPDNCSEPKEFCTITKRHRKQDMYHLLEALRYKEYTPIVMHSRQLAPGVGGISPGQLFSFLKKIQQHKGHFLLCTACRCHGVITSVNRL